MAGTGQRKYSQQVYEASIASFNALPLAAVLDRRFFCVHGGISPELTTVDEINRVNYFSPYLYIKHDSNDLDSEDRSVYGTPFSWFTL